MSAEGCGKKSLRLKDVIRNFTPAWFTVIMGTGVISILFHNFSYGNETKTMKIFSLIFFFLNLLLSIIFSVATVVRYIMFPEIWPLMIRHPVQSLYVGCIPMGFTTLINVAVSLIYQDYGFGGNAFLLFVWAIWWIDVAMSLVCCWIMVHIMKTRQSQPLDRMTAVWILPVVPLVVASSSGGVLALALGDIYPSHALVTVTFSVFMVTIGLSLSLMLLTIYILRLIVYGLPPGATVLSVFLPLGPMGQAGYGILLIGRSFRALLPLRHGTSEFLTSTSTGETINTICVCISFVLWCLATMWFVWALLAIQEVLQQTRFPFKVPFWGLIFPNGVYANLTIELYRTFNVRFFRDLGAIYAICTLILWAGVTVRTVMLVQNARIFEAPCLEDVDMTRHTENLKPERLHDSETNGTARDRSTSMISTTGLRI